MYQIIFSQLQEDDLKLIVSQVKVFISDEVDSTVGNGRRFPL